MRSPGMIALAAAWLLVPRVADAAMLRPFTQISSGTVRLTDLFDDLGSTPDRVLGRGPAPGARIEVAAPQLAAIARDFNVDWRPATGDEQAVIERRGDLLSRDAVLEALRPALQAAGAPAAAQIAMPDIQPVLIPAGSFLKPEISQCSYEASAGRFTALVTVTSPDMPPVQMRVSGAVIIVVPATVAVHRLARGGVVTAADIEPARVRAGLLRGNTAIQPAQAIGMSVKRDVPAGQPLTTLDVARPDLVMRGSVVRMSLLSDGIALSAEGVAKESGALGDRVHVENPSSRAVVEAEVTGEGEVRVSPRGGSVARAEAP